MFTPIVKENPAYPNKYYEKIIASISDMIASEELKPGDLLPSERELAEQFQLSRVPVREALKILEFLGVIKYIPGKGMQVQRIEIPSLLSKMFFGINATYDTIRQLFEIRLLIEPYAAAQAALCATPEDLKKIYGALTVNETDSPSNLSMNFHQAIIAASHNQLLSEIYKFLYTLLELSRRSSDLNSRYNNSPLRFHLDIYTAIREGNSAAAEKLMREHLASEQTYLKAVMASKQHGKLQVTD